MQLWPRHAPDFMTRETLVLLPGMMCDARLFAPQVEAFDEQYRILIPDLVAHSITDMATNVLADCGDEKFNLAGLSMGGIVAMEMVRQAPERVLRIGLLDTNHLADAPEKFDMRNRQINDVQRGKLREVIIEEMKPVYLAERNRGDQHLLDILIDMAIEVGAETFIAQSLALRDRVDQSETLKTYRGPSLVLCGAEDNLCPPERHREIADLLPDAELHVLPGAGHITTLETPDSVNQAMADWLSR